MSVVHVLVAVAKSLLIGQLSCPWRRTAAVCAALAWAGGGPTAAGTSPAKPRVAHAERSIKIGFWLGMHNNETMTPGMVQWLGERASFIVIRGQIKGLDPYYDYRAIIQRCKQQAPDVPVLIYDRAQDAGKSSLESIDRENGDEVLAHPEWLLRNRDGSYFAPRPGRNDDATDFHVDPTNPQFRQYIAEYLAGAIRRYGADGVAVDSYSKFVPLYFGDLGRLMNGERLANGGYEEGTAAMTAAIKQAIGPDKLFIFNSLGHNAPPHMKLDIQATLLPFADGASEEWFGFERSGNEKDHFDLTILDAIRTMAAHPDKIIAIYGRCPRSVYTGYDEDYQYQRYDLACYLLGMTPLSTFKYHVSFQATIMPRQRTNGFDYYRDYDLDLGKPLGGFTESGGAYLRRFEKALVAVAPIHRGAKRVILEGTWFNPEGRRVEGALDLADGQGMILLRQPLQPEPARVMIDDFENGDARAWREGARDDKTEVLQEGSNRFLRAELSPSAFRPYHERRVQPIRSLTPYGRLDFRIRTRDTAGAVMVRLEVDDLRPHPVPEEVGGKPPRSMVSYRQETRMPFAVLVIKPEDGSFAFPAKNEDIPYGVMDWQNSRIKPQSPFYATPGVGYCADGRWQTVSLKLTQVLARVAPHLKARRIVEIRLLGNADLDDVAIEQEG